MVKKKSFILIVILMIFMIFAIVNSYHRKNGSDDNQAIPSLTKEEQENLNYSFEIPKEINVLGIVSEKEIVVLDNNKLKKYNLEKKKFDKEFANVNENYQVKGLCVFDDGIIWCENQVEPNIKSKIYIKYFSANDGKELLDESESEILPALSISSKYLTYYIVNNNMLEIKIFNLSNKENNIIKSYELTGFSNMPYISTPSTNDNEVVWSVSQNGKSKILKYNINDKGIIEFNKSQNLFSPVLQENRILAIRKNDFEDKELNIVYASDYIVEYDYEKNEWVKFLENEIDKYIDFPRESVISLSSDGKLLYWESTFNNGNYLYDFVDKKIYSLTKSKSSILTSINFINKNIVYYEAQNSNSKDKSKFIYIIDELSS